MTKAKKDWSKEEKARLNAILDTFEEFLKLEKGQLKIDQMRRREEKL